MTCCRRAPGRLRAPRSPLRIGVAWVPILLVAGCETGPSATPVQRPSLPESVFRRIHTVTLEESSEVINVAVDVTVEGDGSFLIADAGEARVRKYDSAGRLVYQFGSKGDGPGEFGMPLEVHRLPGTGRLRVLDISKGLLEFGPNGEGYIRASRPPIAPAYTAASLDEGRTLVAGIVSGAEDPRRLLHVWDLEADTMLRSFFPTPGDSLTRLVARNFGWADFDRRGDSTVAVAAFTDTVFVFGPQWEEIDRVPLPMDEFPRIRSFDARTPDEIEAWLEERLLIIDVHWLGDRSLLIQYQRPRGTDNEWNLLWTNLSGDRILSVTNTPQLLAVHADRLYFLDPESLTAGQWVVAELRAP